MVTIKYTKGAIVFAIAPGTFILLCKCVVFICANYMQVRVYAVLFFGDERHVKRST